MMLGGDLNSHFACSAKSWEIFNAHRGQFAKFPAKIKQFILALLAYGPEPHYKISQCGEGELNSHEIAPTRP